MTPPAPSTNPTLIEPPSPACCSDKATRQLTGALSPFHVTLQEIGALIRPIDMNSLNVSADSKADALVDFLEGRRGEEGGRRRALLTSSRSLAPGLRDMAGAQVELVVDGLDRWSVEIPQGSVGLFGARSRTEIHGEPELLESIIKGTASGVEAFLDGRVRVRGNIALSLQIEGLFATRRRPKRFPRPEMFRAGEDDTFYLDAVSGPPSALPPLLPPPNPSPLPPLPTAPPTP